MDNLPEDVRNLLKEWKPSFDAGEYSPGDGSIGKPDGDGVADQLPTDDSDCCDKLDDHGDPVGAEHNETAAMCDVDENGVENKPQGVHNSKPAKPDDGHTKPVVNSESWSPETVSQLLGADFNLQSLFNEYAKSVQIVCLEDFQVVCNNNGCETAIDYDSFIKLMEHNEDYIFYIVTSAYLIGGLSFFHLARLSFKKIVFH